MGYKRPFVAEELQELSFKQARQVEYGIKLSQFSDSSLLDDPAHKHKNIVLGNNSAPEVSNLAKDFEMLVPLSWVSCELSGFGASSLPTLSPEYIGSSVSRTVIPPEDMNFSYMDNYPRKLIPVGPNHQARIPPLEPHVRGDKMKMRESYSADEYSQYNIYSEDEERLMGTCVIPMPDITLLDGDNKEVGIGRADFHCMDEGSVRCVRQHILEAREKLKQTFGKEKFMYLGFYNMGEEVAYKWSDDEEHIFRSVVYSNPVSLGYNFWNHLKPSFPSKTFKEVVSYYFNVFMLRRRAAQNRSSMLDIDSDDDEVHGISKASSEVHRPGGEDSGLVSRIHGPEQPNWREDIVEDYSDEDDHDDSSDGDVDARHGTGDLTGEDSDIDNTDPHDVQPCNINCKFGFVAQHADKKVASDGPDLTVQDDSCTSYEFQDNRFEIYAGHDTDNNLQVSEVKTVDGKYFPVKEDHYPDLGSHLYLEDVCDGKIWDARYTSAPDTIKGFDLLPTSNIIEEIFGQETFDEKNKI